MTFEEWQESAFSGGLGGGKSIAKMAWHARDEEVKELREQIDAMLCDEQLADREMERLQARIEQVAATYTQELEASSKVIESLRARIERVRASTENCRANVFSQNCGCPECRSLKLLCKEVMAALEEKE